MNREEKAAAVASIAEQIKESDAVFAVDYRGISVTQIAELRAKLRESDSTFRVVKNSLTERAADDAGVATLKELLTGPTALTFVRGDAASAAKAISNFNRETQLVEFKGGVMNGEALEIDQIKAIAKLPARDVLYGQLVGIVASPITGLARGLGGLLGGLAIALGDLQRKKESGEVPAGEAPAAPAEEAAAEEPAAEAAETPAAEEAPAAEVEEAPAEEAPAAEAEEAPADQDAESPDEGKTPHAEEPAEGADDETAEPEAEAPAEEAPAAEAEADAGDETNENEADASA
jgi:large subunit ribosomal protein L10